MTNKKELQPAQPEEEQELPDDDRLADVAGGRDYRDDFRWCPRKRRSSSLKTLPLSTVAVFLENTLKIFQAFKRSCRVSRKYA